MNFQKGDIITYEYLRRNDGIKYNCVVGEVREIDGSVWVIDAVHHGTYQSNSFRPQDVIVWEHKKGKSSK